MQIYAGRGAEHELQRAQDVRDGVSPRARARAQELEVHRAQDGEQRAGQELQALRRQLTVRA